MVPITTWRVELPAQIALKVITVTTTPPHLNLVDSTTIVLSVPTGLLSVKQGLTIMIAQS
jgi:hypothetical protein